jgi:hypothetical protein
VECSGHGTCSGYPAYACTCNDGWTGGDCSVHACPYGPAWFDYPTSTDVAHADAECSNKGACNRNSGACECEVGFDGAACERMACPQSSAGVCSGHGQCLSQSALAAYATVNGEATPYTYGANAYDTTHWDARQVYGCLCDSGFTGYDCSQYSCAWGEDITAREANPTLRDEVQVLVCQYLSSGSPTFRLSFRDAVTIALPYSASAATIQSALEELPTIGRITVTLLDAAAPLVSTSAACTTGAGSRIVFSFQTEHGDVPPIRVMMSGASSDGTWASGDGWASAQLQWTGGDPFADFTVSYQYQNNQGSGGAGYIATGVRTLEITKGTTTTAECSGRGTCDRSTGVCQCYAGFGASNGARGPGDIEDCGWREAVQVGLHQAAAWQQGRGNDGSDAARSYLRPHSKARSGTAHRWTFDRD